MTGRIIVPAAVLALIQAEAVAAYPAECCGLLVGHAEPDGSVVMLRAVPSPNLLALEPGRFEVDPGLRLRLMRTTRTEGTAIVGHYHSHPDRPALPSATDTAMAFEPDLVWLIVPVAQGIAGPVRAFRLGGGRPGGHEELPVAAHRTQR